MDVEGTETREILLKADDVTVNFRREDVRSMRQGQDGNMNAKLNARATSNRTSANGQLERHGFTNKSRMNGPTREGRGLVEGRAMRGVSVSEERYGRVCFVADIR